MATQSTDVPAIQHRGTSPAIEAPSKWDESVRVCLRRIHRWQTPPNWKGSDWSDEMDSVAKLAALQAREAFDPARGTPFNVFLQSRVLARALTHYRHEWGYAIRHLHGIGTPDGSDEPCDQQIGFSHHAASDSDGDSVLECLADLPRQHRQLLEALFVHEFTEADVARRLGVGRRAINKRKHAALGRLRDQLDPQCENSARHSRATTIANGPRLLPSADAAPCARGHKKCSHAVPECTASRNKLNEPVEIERQ